MRAPLISGIPWDKDGNIKPEWAAWFNAISSLTEQTQQKSEADSTGITMSQVPNIDPRGVAMMAVAYSMMLNQPQPSTTHDTYNQPMYSGVPTPVVPQDLRSLIRPTTFVAPKIVTCTQATFPTLIQLIPDTFIYVSDYMHFLYWNGTASVMITPNEFTAIGEPDGSAPRGGLWGVCDGSSYNVLRPDGTLVSITTQNLTGGRFIRGNSTVDAGLAASMATWQAGAKTDDESAHTHQIDPPNTGTSDDGGSATVQSGSGATVAAHPHGHDVDIAPFTSGAGTAHSHNLSNANAKLNVPSDANGGVPDRISVVFYMRR